MKGFGCLYLAIFCLCCVSTESKGRRKKNKENGWKNGYLKKTLYDYGYTESDKPSRHEMEDAATKVKILYHFEDATSDKEVMKVLKKPRCGNRDMEKKKTKRGRRYVFNSAWRKRSLTYAFQTYTSDLSEQQQNDIAARAFQLWKNSVPELDFTPSGPDEADIKIRFERGPHDGCSKVFDGRGPIIAHAYDPEDGRIHLDDDEQFTDESSEGVNLYSVLVHEIGHVLGLGHSFIQEAIMFPLQRNYTPGLTLHEDDINGMRMLYAPETAEDPSCVDLDPSNCVVYKRHEYCSHSTDAMMVACPYTCDLCED